MALESVALDLTPTATLHGLGPRLQDIELAGIAILPPLDIHRAAIVLFDEQRLARQRRDIRIGQAVACALGRRHIFGAHAMRRIAPFGVSHLDRLAAQLPAHDRKFAGAQRRLVDIELIRIDGPLYDRFAQTIGSRDEYHIAEAGFGVKREQHAAGTDIAADHQLDAGRECHARVIKPLVHAIGDGPIVEQRGEYLVRRAQQVSFAAHVQVSLLLAGKGGVGQILGRGRGADRDRDVGTIHGLPRRDERLLKGSGEGGFEHPATDALTAAGESFHIIDIQAGQFLCDARIEAVMREEFAKGIRGGRESWGHFDAQPAQMADHLAQGGVLAADALDIVHAQLGKRDHIGTQSTLLDK